MEQEGRRSEGSCVNDLEAHGGTQRHANEVDDFGGMSVDEEGMEVTNMVAPVESSRGRQVSSLGREQRS